MQGKGERDKSRHEGALPRARPEEKSVQKDLESMSQDVLKELAKQEGVQGYESMSKEKLMAALKPRSAAAAGVETSVSRAVAQREDEAAEPKPPGTEKAGAGKAKAAKPGTADVAETDIEAEEAETSEAVAAPAIAPEAPRAKPRFPQSWVKNELLIDEGLPELPDGYGDDRLVLLVRDPYWLYLYWDLNPGRVRWAKEQGGRQATLRISDVTGLHEGNHGQFEIPCSEGARGWYVSVPTDGRTYVAEYGYKAEDGRFLVMVRSNAGTTPISHMSAQVADTFVTIPYGMPLQEHGNDVRLPETGQSLAEAMYELSGGGNWSADVLRWTPGDLHAGRPRPVWEEESLSSHSLSSHSLGQQPPAVRARQRDFWLVADAELIVYGATEPDAKVTLQGHPVQLRPDGTFTARFSLPDGELTIPIRGVDALDEFERKITFKVTRDTRHG